MIALLSAVLAAAAFAAPSSDVGALILAHGGDPTWNKTVSHISATVGRNRPTEVAFGMADGDAMQKAVDALRDRGAKRIVAVPLFVSSHSSLYRQSQYLLGARAKPDQDFLNAMRAMHEAGVPMAGMMGSMDSMNRVVKSSVPVSVSPALDDDPIVAEILAKRAKALAKDPSKAALVLVAHGPIEEDDDRAWLADLGRLARAVQKKVPFKDTAAATLRDDAPPPVRQAAVDKLRGEVKELSKGGTVVVVPVLIAPGGIERKLPKDLKGLKYRWNGRTLAPDPLLADWVERRVEETK